MVDKPTGLLSQSDISGDRDLLSLLKQYLARKYDKPGRVFLALVQRLDRNTRGLLVMARTSKAASRLSDQIRRNLIEKQYLVIVHGRLDQEQTMVHYLVKDQARMMASATTADNPDARRAELAIKPLQYIRNTTLARVTLITGRFHQIRVQLSSEGHPVCGDVKYGGTPLPGNRLALMCHQLNFRHPVRDEIMRFTLPLPAEKPWSVFRHPADGSQWQQKGL